MELGMTAHSRTFNHASSSVCAESAFLHSASVPPLDAADSGHLCDSTHTPSWLQEVILSVTGCSPGEERGRWAAAVQVQGICLRLRCCWVGHCRCRRSWSCTRVVWTWHPRDPWRRSGGMSGDIFLSGGLQERNAGSGEVFAAVAHTTCVTIGHKLSYLLPASAVSPHAPAKIQGGKCGPP